MKVRPDIRNFKAFLPAACSVTALALSTAFDHSIALACLSGTHALLAARIAIVDASRFIIPTLELGLLGLLGLLFIVIDPRSDLLERLLASIAQFFLYGLVFELIRRSYLLLRHRHGMGQGDVKLAAVLGLWLPPEGFSVVVFCAAISGIITIYICHFWYGSRTLSNIRIPFGAMLSPWAWMIWFGLTVFDV